jgi:hypothetical protein
MYAQHVRSVLFNHVGTHKTYGRSVLGIKCVYDVSELCKIHASSMLLTWITVLS